MQLHILIYTHEIFCTNEASSSQEWFLGHLVRVKVMLRLLSGHSVHSSAEALLGLITKLYSAYSVYWMGRLLFLGRSLWRDCGCACCHNSLSMSFVRMYKQTNKQTHKKQTNTHIYIYIYTCFVLVYIHVFKCLRLFTIWNIVHDLWQFERCTNLTYFAFL